MPGLSELKYISAGNPTAYVGPNTPYVATSPFPFSMKSLFTDNSLVFYKPGSLSVSGGGTVVNARSKSKRT